MTAATTQDTTGSSIAVFDDSHAALAALHTLKDAGFDKDKVSVIGKGVKETKEVHGWVPQGSKAGSFGAWGALWGALSGWLLLGFVWLPGIGWVAAAGWLASTILGAGIGAGLGALTGLAVPEDEVPVYENDLKAERYLVVVHGTPAEVEKAHTLLAAAGPVRVSAYAA